MKYFTIIIVLLLLSLLTAGYSPKTLVVVITIVAAGVAIAVSLGFTSYHKGIKLILLNFVSPIFLYIPWSIERCIKFSAEYVLIKVCMIPYPPTIRCQKLFITLVIQVRMHI